MLAKVFCKEFGNLLRRLKVVELRAARLEVFPGAVLDVDGGPLFPTLPFRTGSGLRFDGAEFG